MIERVTIRDVARKAGVSIATVSRAMNPTAACAPETREKVRKVVRELGYEPDRLVSSLAHYRRNHEVRPMTYSVAWLIDSREHRLNTVMRKLIEVSRGIGESMGVFISVEKSHEHGCPERTAKVLHNRGVDGIVLTNIMEQDVLEEFDWSNFSVVSYLQERFSVPFDLVREHYFRSFFDSWRAGLDRGHRRIGAVLPSVKNSRQNDTLKSVSAYFHELTDEAIPDLIQIPEKDGSRDHYAAEVVEWFTTYRPSLVIGKNEGVLYYLSKAGFRCPQDFSFVAVKRGVGFDDLSGFELNLEKIASVLLEKVVSGLLYGRKGAVEAPAITLIPSRWCEGRTLVPLESDPQ